MTLEQTLGQIRPLDEGAMSRARLRWNSIAKPLGSLGLLEDAVVQVAGITGSDRIDLGKKAVVVFCADNGVVAQGVTQTDSSVTAVVTENFAKGGSCVNRMAQVAGAQVFPVDIGVAKELHVDGLLSRKIAYGTADMTQGPAMSRRQAVEALEVGIEMAHQLNGDGFRILATGEMGIGNTTASSALAAVFLGRKVETVTGKGAGLSAQGLARKIAAIHRALEQNRPDPADAVGTLAKVGGLDIAGMAGLFLGGAQLGLPVVVDGFISAVAALTAMRICPAVRGHMLASHVSDEPAGPLLMEELGLKPFLTCGMRLGEGTGAVAALPILEMAAAVYSGMSTFEENSIQRYQPL